MQPQALLAQALGPPAVQRALAVGGIANDGVRQVLEVAAYLVAPPGGGHGLHQRSAGGGKARVAGFGQRQLRQRAKPGVGALHGGVRWGIVGAQGVVHFYGGGRPAAHHGDVDLVRGLVLKRLGKRPGRVAVQRHHQHAAGAFVQPVHREDVSAQLVAQGLHHKAGFARVQPCAVHQPARRLVHGHQVVVLPEDVQGLGHGGGCWDNKPNHSPAPIHQARAAIKIENRLEGLMGAWGHAVRWHTRQSGQ